MRFALALLFLVHGIAHFAGFALAWQLGETPSAHYSTRILASKIDLGPRGIRIYGVLWLLLALAFITLALAVFQQSALWFRGAIVLSAISTVLCLLSLPQTRVGLWLDILILLGLYLGNARGWFVGLTT